MSIPLSMLISLSTIKFQGGITMIEQEQQTTTENGEETNKNFIHEDAFEKHGE